MSRSLLDDAFAHHVWATLRLIDVCLALSPAQLDAAVPATDRSILATMRHVIGDGSFDLFVASGSSEFEPGAKELRSRLYLNDGKGNFAAAPASAMPAILEFASAVCAVDYDHDGRPDLFVGARAVPGDYPRSGRSRRRTRNSFSASAQ